MTAIDTDEVLSLLRTVGASLCDTFWQMEAVNELDDMFAAFRRIDGAPAATLRTTLARAYPRIGWIEGEFDGADGDDEQALALLEQGEYWICHAIDGAVQFLRAIPQWAMALTLVREGVPVFVAVFDAAHDEMFHAVRGGGAYCNGKPVRVHGRESHYNGIVATSQPPFAARRPRTVERAGRSLSAMLRDVVAVRNLGPTSLQLAYVACGRLDGFWEFGEDGFNCVGPALLVREAGGVVTQIDGAPYGLRSADIAAAGPRVQASMLLRLQEVL